MTMATGPTAFIHFVKAFSTAAGSSDPENSAEHSSVFEPRRELPPSLSLSLFAGLTNPEPFQFERID
jgi:hypothetical protein